MRKTVKCKAWPPILALHLTYESSGYNKWVNGNQGVMRHSTPLYLMDVEPPVIGDGSASVDEFKGDRLLRTIQSKKRGQQ